MEDNEVSKFDSKPKSSSFVLFFAFSMFAAGLLAAALLKSCTEKQALSSIMHTVLDSDSVRYWKDQYGIEHLQLLNTETTFQQFLNIYPDSLEKVSKLLRIKTKQLEGMQHVAAESDVHFTAPIVYQPTGIGTFNYSTPTIKMSGTIDSGKVAISDTVTVSLDIVPYWQRERQLLGIRYGRIQHFVDISSTDPTVRVTSASSLRIKAKQPGRIGVGPYVGVDLLGRPSVGVGVFYSVIRF